MSAAIATMISPLMMISLSRPFRRASRTMIW